MRVGSIFSIFKSCLGTIGLSLLLMVPGCIPEKFPDEFIDDREAFDQSILAFWEANNMFKRQPGQSIVLRTPNQEKKYFEQISNGINISQNISDEFLDYLHPDLKKMYRESLIPGKRDYLEGALSGNRFKQGQGSRKVIVWEDFWEANKAEIVAKTYPEKKS